MGRPPYEASSPCSRTGRLPQLPATGRPLCAKSGRSLRGQIDPKPSFPYGTGSKFSHPPRRPTMERRSLAEHRTYWRLRVLRASATTTPRALTTRSGNWALRAHTQRQPQMRRPLFHQQTQRRRRRRGAVTMIWTFSITSLGSRATRSSKGIASPALGARTRPATAPHRNPPIK